MSKDPLSHYQQQTERLLRETEQQRREIVILRKDLSAALTMYVRGSIIVGCVQTLDGSREMDRGRAQLDLDIAIDNWKQNSMGAPAEILARIDTLSRLIP